MYSNKGCILILADLSLLGIDFWLKLGNVKPAQPDLTTGVDSRFRRNVGQKLFKSVSEVSRAFALNVGFAICW